MKRIGFVEVSTSEDTYREVTARRSEDLFKRNGFWVDPCDFFNYKYIVFKDETNGTVLGIHEIKRTWRFDRNYDSFLERMFGFGDGELDRRFEQSKWVDDSMGGGFKTDGDDELYVAEIGDKVADVNDIFNGKEVNR